MRNLVDGFWHLILVKFTPCCCLFNLHRVWKPTYAWYRSCFLDLIGPNRSPVEFNALVLHELQRNESFTAQNPKIPTMQ